MAPWLPSRVTEPRHFVAALRTEPTQSSSRVSPGQCPVVPGECAPGWRAAVVPQHACPGHWWSRYKLKGHRVWHLGACSLVNKEDNQKIASKCGIIIWRKNWEGNEIMGMEDNNGLWGCQMGGVRLPPRTRCLNWAWRRTGSPAASGSALQAKRDLWDLRGGQVGRARAAASTGSEQVWAGVFHQEGGGCQTLSDFAPALWVLFRQLYWRLLCKYLHCSFLSKTT